MVSDGKITISTELDNSALPKGINQVKGQLGGLGNVVKKLGVAIGAAFSVRAIVNFAAESVKAANELSSALTGLQSILDGQGRSFADAEKFLKEYTADGLVPMTNAVAAYKNLAARGYDDSQIQQTMAALKDASAFGRQSSYSMGEAVQSATEGLKNENSVLVDNAGVTKNVAKMWEEYAASIGTTANNLTKEQKIQAEVNGILEETKFQTGDAAKVAGALSGQLSQLSVNFNSLKVAVGNAAKPVVQAFLPAINSAVAAMTKFANSVASVMSALFGSVSSSTADAVTEVADGYENAASGAEDLTNATVEAGKAAKKYLAGFDEIQKLGSDSSTATNSTSTVSTTVVATTEIQDEISPQIQAIVDNIQRFAEKVKEVCEQIQTVLQPSVSAWSGAFSSLGPPVENAGDRISTAWKNLRENSLEPFGEYITTDFCPSMANTFSTTFASIFTDLMPVAMDVWTTDFENSCTLVSELCALLQGAFEGVKTVFSDMCESITKKWDEYGGNLLKGFTDFKNGLWETWWYIYDNIINPVITACSETLTWLWDEHLKPLWDNIVEFALSVSENILALWNGFIKPVVDYVVAYLAPIVTNVINGIWDAICIVFSWISDGISGLLKYLDGFIQFIVGVFTTDWERAWGGIKKMFEGVWTSFEGTVKGAVNAVIWVINQLIATIYSGIAGVVNGLGGIVNTIGDMLGKDWGFSIPTQVPKIPYLAQGAVLPANKPFLAMVGDQKHGTNIEAPLETIQEAVALVMEDMTGGMMAGFEATVAVLKEILEAVYGIEIGDDVIGKAVARYNSKMATARGG